MSRPALRAVTTALVVASFFIAIAAPASPLVVLPRRVAALPAGIAVTPEAAGALLDAAARDAVAPLLPPGAELGAPHVKRAIGSWTLRWPQVREGLVVEGRGLAVSLLESADGSMSARVIENDLVAVPPAPVPSPALAAIRAEEIAGQMLVTWKPEAPTVIGDVGPAVLELDPSGTQPAWLVRAEGREPAVSLRVVLSATDGRVLSVRDEILRVTGTGQVFEPNAVIVMRDATLTDQNDVASAVPAAAYSLQPLQDLYPPVAGMHALKGAYAFVDDFAQPRDALASEADPNAFVYLRDDQRFEQVMVYRTLTELERYIQSLGFTNVLNRQLHADAHALTADNSFFNGGNFTLNFGDGGVDDAEDGDVITHEAGHALQADVIPGYGGGNESGALGEAMGDYLAGTRHDAFGFNSECIAGWDASSYSGANPPCLRRLDSTKHYPEAIVGEVHADGEIWSAAMWQIRQRRGANVTDRVLIQSQFLLGTNPSFRDAALALLQADADLGTGAHDDICQVMIARGILQPADCPEALAIEQVTVDDTNGGDGDGYLEPGEDADLVVRLHSTQVTTATLVSVTLTPQQPAIVTMLNATAAYPDIAPAASADPLVPVHRVRISSSAPCDTDLVFDADISSAGFAGTDSFVLHLGEPVPLGPKTGSFAGPPIAIPDNDPAGISSGITLGGTGVVGALSVSVDITHPYIGDLNVDLVSPAGTTVRLHAQSGGGTANLVTTYPAPTGVDGPGAITDFENQAIAGTWTLRVADVARRDTGTLNAWSLNIDARDYRCDFGVPPCPGQVIATGIDGVLRVSKGAAGSLVLTFPGAASACATGVQVRRAATPRPATEPGTWPADPAFADVTGEDSDPGPAFSHVPSAGNSYYLVAETLPDGSAGPSGSY